jgi:hypothetical protein
MKLLNVFKSLFIAGAICAPLMASAQVTIGSGAMPQATLDIVGSYSTDAEKGKAFRLDDGNQAPGKVLTAGENGIGSWQNIGALAATTYTISNVNQDFIASFDTKIPYADYTVWITGFQFAPKISQNPDSLQATRYLYASNGIDGSSTWTADARNTAFGALNVIAKKNTNTGTWCLYADYAPAHTLANGTWMLNCLIAKNTFITVIPDQTYDLKGSANCAATAKPEGL